MKKIVFALLIFFTAILNISALDLNSKNAILYNLNDKTVIFKQNENEITSIASLTKIMTTLVAIEKIDNYDAFVTIKSSMLAGLKEKNAAVIGLKVGQKITYEDLLYGTFLASGADAARALSISLVGTEEDFVKLMNDKAKELGLTNTNFINTTGLDEDGQTSTVDEVAKLLMKALENKVFEKIFYAKSYTLSDKSMTVYSTLFKTASKYKIDSSYFLGGKTGYTDNAGRCLASIAYDSENKISYLLVTTNADIDDGEHVKDAAKIYDYYFKNYKYHNLVNINDLLITLPTKYVKEETINLYANKEVSAYLENTFDKKNVKLTYSGLEELKAGLKKGDKIGNIKVSYNDKDYEDIDVVLQQDLKFSLLVFIKENILVILVSIILIILTVFFMIKKKKGKRKKK